MCKFCETYNKNKYSEIYDITYKQRDYLVEDEPDQLKIYSNRIHSQDVEAIMALHTSKKLVTLPKLGGGENGTVFMFEGVQGKQYAVKSIDYRRYDSEDVFFVEKLMGCDRLPTVYMSYGKSLLVMEKVDGSTLEELVEDMDKIENIADNFMDVLWEQVNFCLSRGVIPYDLKFSNIMVDRRTGLPVIVDFGHFRLANDPVYDNEFSMTRMNDSMKDIALTTNALKTMKQLAISA